MSDDFKFKVGDLVTRVGSNIKGPHRIKYLGKNYLIIGLSDTDKEQYFNWTHDEKKRWQLYTPPEEKKLVSPREIKVATSAGCISSYPMAPTTRVVLKNIKAINKDGKAWGIWDDMEADLFFIVEDK